MSNGNGQKPTAEQEAQDRIERLLPQNVEAEQAVLGALMIDNEAVPEVAQLLRPEDFYRSAHRNIFEAMLALYDRQEPVDYVTVVEELAHLRARLEKSSRRDDPLRQWPDISLDDLACWAERVPTSANVGMYARQVRAKADLRSFITAGTEAVRAAYEHVGPSAEFLEEAEREILAVTQRDAGSHQVVTVRDAMQEVCNDLDEHADRGGSITGIPSGVPDLDEKTGGFQDEEMIIVAGRPSMGKTTLISSFTRYICSQDIPVAFSSLEVGRRQLIHNMLCAEARIDSKRLRAGNLDEYEYERVVEASRRIAAYPLWIDDTPGLSLRALRAKSRWLVENRGIRLVVVDYLQLMTPPTIPGRPTREEKIATISRGIKALARELRIPVVILAQLNRESEKRSGSHRPRMSDLRESGSLEQDCDVLALLHREHYYTRNDEDAGKAELILAKQRNGPTGSVQLRFQPELLRFDPIEYGAPQEYAGEYADRQPAGQRLLPAPAQPTAGQAQPDPGYTDDPDRAHEPDREEAPFDLGDAQLNDLLGNAPD